MAKVIKEYRTATQEAFDDCAQHLMKQGYHWYGDWEWKDRNTIINVWSDFDLTADASVTCGTPQEEWVIISNQPKPVIPQYVADWIEICKRGGESLHTALNGHEYSDIAPGCYSPMREWLTDNEHYKEREELFAKAWLDGYTVEKEQLYYVKLLDGYNGYLKLNMINGRTFFSKRGAHSNYKIKFTKAEIKAINPAYWNEAFLEKVND